MKFSLFREKQDKPKEEKKHFRFKRRQEPKEAPLPPPLIRELYDIYDQPKEEKSSLEKMNYEELGKEYDFWQAEYSKNPTNNTREMIAKIGDLMNKKVNEPQQTPEIKIPEQEKLSSDDEKKLSEMVNQIALEHNIDWETTSVTKRSQILEYAKKQLALQKALDGITEPDVDEEKIAQKTQIKELLAEVDLLKTENSKLENTVKQQDLKIIDMVKQNHKDHDIIQKLQQEINKQAKKETAKLALEQASIPNAPLQNDMKTYNLMQKTKPDKSSEVHYALNNLDLVCHNCKHFIQLHASKGQSTGCKKCGCLETIENIAKQNMVKLLKKEEYATMKKEQRKPMMGNLSFMKPKTPKVSVERSAVEARIVEENDLEKTIEKQAESLKSMKIKETAKQMEQATLRKLSHTPTIDAKKVLGNDTCTCSHKANDHYELEQFCSVKNCQCSVFRNYPN